MIAKMRIGPKGQVVIPKMFRDDLGLKPGEEVVVDYSGKDITIRKSPFDIAKIAEGIAKSSPKSKPYNFLYKFLFSWYLFLTISSASEIGMLSLTCMRFALFSCEPASQIFTPSLTSHGKV